MKTILTLKTDKDLKTQAQAVAKELGIPLTTAINTFLRQFVRDRRLVLSADYSPSPYLQAILEEARRERQADEISSAQGVNDLLRQLDK